MINEWIILTDELSQQKHKIVTSLLNFAEIQKKNDEKKITFDGICVCKNGIVVIYTVYLGDSPIQLHSQI